MVPPTFIANKKSVPANDFWNAYTNAGGRNRTDMEQAPLDFESSASTNFTTPALL